MTMTLNEDDVISPAWEDKLDNDPEMTIQDYLMWTRNNSATTANKTYGKVKMIMAELGWLNKEDFNKKEWAGVLITLGDFKNFMTETPLKEIKEAIMNIKYQGNPINDATLKNYFQAIVGICYFNKILLKYKTQGKELGLEQAKRFYPMYDDKDKQDEYEKELNVIEKSFNKTNNKAKEERESPEPTEKVKKNWATMKQLKERAELTLDTLKGLGVNYKKGKFPEKVPEGASKREEDRIRINNNKITDAIQQAVIAQLYTQFPPRRADYVGYVAHNGEFIPTLWSYNNLKQDDKHNYFNYTKPPRKKFGYFTYVSNHHKTSESKGKFDRKIDDIKLIKLLLLLRDWTPSGAWQDQTPVFRNPRDNFTKPMNTNDLIHNIKRVFDFDGKNISIDMLRKIFDTEISKPLLDKVEEIADEMSHDLKTAKTYMKNIKKD